MTEIERGPEAVAVRELYEGHEPLVEGAAARLMPAVRLRLHRRRTAQRIGYAAVVLVVVLVLGGAAAAVSLGRPTEVSASVLPANGETTSGSNAPPGYQIVSSLGAEITVPADWDFNDIGCRSSDRPTVVRGPYAVLLCLSRTLPDKEFIYLQPATRLVTPAQTIGDDAARLAGHPVRVDGVAGTRAEGRVSGGQYGGWVILPGRDVEVFGRTNDRATLTRILDSVRLVDVDHAGCPTHAPTAELPHSGLSTFVDPDPEAISVCFYAGEPVLQASALRTGSDAKSLAAALNATKTGTGPVGNCLAGSFPTGMDARLLVRSADGTVRPVDATFQACLHRHMDNGDGSHKLPVPLMTQILAGMATGVDYVLD